MAENFFGITDTGRHRDNNEDAFIAEKLPTGWILACVIDGVGGYEGGEVAAEIARKTIVQKMQRAGGDVLHILREALLQANQDIYNEKLSGKGNNQMACVLTLALVDTDGNQFHYAHVGDTRLYLLRDQSLVKVTKDHSFVGFLEDSGRLSEKEAMTHPKRNEINKALGFDAQIDLKEDYIETGSSPFLPGDLLMLCSDGLTDLVNNKDMTGILLSSASLAQKGKALVDAANNAGGKDNITVVLVKNNKQPAKQKATKPVLVKKNKTAEQPKPVATPEKHAVPRPVVKAKKTNTALWIFSLLALLFAGLAFWFWSKSRTLEASLPKPPAERPLNAGEKKLGDSLGLASRLFQLSTANFGASVVVSDTLYIRQDSLHINGNGIVLQSDSAYSGPAFLATANNRYLVLENITFKDFQTALNLRGRGVQLRNVQFQNCKVSVLRSYVLPADSTLTAVLRDTVILKRDSLPK